jgi:hypothetical protein
MGLLSALFDWVFGTGSGRSSLPPAGDGDEYPYHIDHPENPPAEATLDVSAWDAERGRPPTASDLSYVTYPQERGNTFCEPREELDSFQRALRDAPTPWPQRGRGK